MERTKGIYTTDVQKTKVEEVYTEIFNNRVNDVKQMLTKITETVK